MPTDATDARWSSAWPDALAFAAGLGVAAWSGWSTTDLVWSLWLSSLVVGYATIVWTIGRPVAAVVRGTMGLRGPDAAAALPGASVALAVTVVGGLLMLAFFTVHFGGFHYVHSQFLKAFFPVDGAGDVRMLAWDGTYAEVVRRYWLFLPAAFLAEREAFLRPATPLPAKGKGGAPPAALTAPYRNVVRLHLLIFFFAGAHFARLDGFAVYAVVYAVYFFPWRMLRRGREATPATAS